MSQCDIAWGVRGAEEAVSRGDIAIIVDTLSFSTTVTVAVGGRGVIIPVSDRKHVARLAELEDAEVSVARQEVPTKGRFSLSPLSFRAIEPGAKVVLFSPNGGLMCLTVASLPNVFIGALINAEAVARAVVRCSRETGGGVTVIAAGERLPDDTTGLSFRIAIEDYLGAGAILSNLDLTKSPEAQVCEAAFRAATTEISDLIRQCDSGVELREMGFEDDVQFSAQLNLVDVVPTLRDGRIVAMT
jgi:2-phosphosulfolactate phosphatase